MTAAPTEDSSGVPVPDVSGLATRLRSFTSANGGSGTAVINYMGRRGARIVVVSENGPFTDAVVGSMEEAVAACEAAGIPVANWDRELTGKVTVSPADRLLMRGTGR